MHCKISLLLGEFMLCRFLSSTFLSSAQARVLQSLSVFMYCDLRREGPTGFISAACGFLFLILLVAERQKEKQISFLYRLKTEILPQAFFMLKE